ncbi:OmpH family outer membrane protein [bacterium]|nr:OmpH family outer membrane protein [bacterium]
MKKLTTLLVATLIFLLPLTALSAKAKGDAGSEIKIGYVDIQKALDTVEDGKKAKDQLKKEFETKKKKIDKMKTEAEKLQGELEKQKLILSNEALQTKQQELQRMVGELRQNAMQYQQELSQKENEAVSSILKEFEAIITEIGKEKGYSLILEKSRDRLLYAPENYDLTDELITAYNKRGKKGKK